MTKATRLAHGPERGGVEPSASAGRRRARDGGGLLGLVAPNSRVHWALLIVSAVGGVVFTATYLIDGALRPGYDWLRQPVSALSVGAGGWVQVVNFVVFGSVSCVTAFASRATLAPGLGAAWYPRLRVLSGLTMIGAALFSQDPARGFPVGAAVPTHPSAHAVVHNLVSYVSLTAVVAELLILARRFRREPRWTGWGPAAIAAAVLMMASLFTFGALMSGNGPAGLFEKIAGLIPTLFGIAFTIRLFANRDARVNAATELHPITG